MKRNAIALLTFLALVFTPIFATSAFASSDGSVEAAYTEWRHALSSGSADPVVRLYDEKGVLLATFNPKPSVGHQAIREYFTTLTALPKLKVKPQESLIRVYGDIAVNSGTYEFSYEKDGKLVTVPARFSFTYKKDGAGWKIIDHHSSLLPQK